VARIIKALLVALGFQHSEATVLKGSCYESMDASSLSSSNISLMMAWWQFPFQNSTLSDIRSDAAALAGKYSWLVVDFRQFTEMQGFNYFGMGPDPGDTVDVVSRQACLGKQRASHLNKHGAELVVPHLGSMDQHVADAIHATHPFATDVDLPVDLQFGVHMLSKLGVDINGWRDKQVRGIKCFASDAWRLTVRIQARSHFDTLRVTRNVNTGFILALSILFGWPDWALADRLTSGMPVAGFVPPTNVFRKAKDCKEQTTLCDILGVDADRWNSSLAIDCKERDNDKVICDSTLAEQADGKLSGAFSKDELDAWFGKGQWRGVRRHTIWQEGKDKWRNIDDAKKSCTNSAALLLDTIRTTPFDVSASILRLARARLGELSGQWQPGISSEDQKDAYHTIPNLRQQLGLCVIAYLDVYACPAAVRFCISWGHVFGFKSAVTNYNRVPEFCIAATRRLLAALSWHFFDDVGTVSFSLDKSTAVAAVPCLFEVTGFPVNPAKHEPWSQELIHLGVVHDLRLAHSDSIVFSPKPGRVEKIVARCVSALQSEHLSSGDAASLRGELGYLFSSSLDKVGKCGLQALADCQYGKTSGWDSSIKLALIFYAVVLPWLEPKSIPLVASSRKQVVLYTDASWEVAHSEGGTEWINAGLGAVLISQSNHAFALASQLSQRWLPLFNPRRTQIVMCEAVAVVDTLHQVKDYVRGSSLLLFIDNIALVCALVKGTSAHSDIQSVVTTIHLILARLDCSWWVEWVPSALNCADGPSRDGKLDPWCARHGIKVFDMMDSGYSAELEPTMQSIWSYCKSV